MKFFISLILIIIVGAGSSFFIIKYNNEIGKYTSITFNGQLFLLDTTNGKLFSINTENTQNLKWKEFISFKTEKEIQEEKEFSDSDKWLKEKLKEEEIKK